MKRANAYGRLIKLDFEKIPIAALMTLAFQARIKIAPAPKINEKTNVKINTYILFAKIFTIFSFAVKKAVVLEIVFTPYCETQSSKFVGLFMIQYVSICARKF